MMITQRQMTEKSAMTKKDHLRTCAAFVLKQLPKVTNSSFKRKPTVSTGGIHFFLFDFTDRLFIFWAFSFSNHDHAEKSVDLKSSTWDLLDVSFILKPTKSRHQDGRSLCIVRILFSNWKSQIENFNASKWWEIRVVNGSIFDSN